MSKADNYRDQSVEELEVAHMELRKEIFQLRNEKRQSSTMEKPHLLRQHRRNIARLLTVLREKRQAAEAK